MAATLAPDPLRSASHRLMAEHLAGPFAGGAVDTEVIVDAAARARVPRGARDPLLLAAPREDLGRGALRFSATLDRGVVELLPAVRFAPWTEAGTFLLVHVPPVDPETRTAGPFAIEISLAEIAGDGAEAPLAPAEVAARIELRLFQGLLGKVIYLLGAEKCRLRRTSRELASFRTLRGARGDALDRYGGDVAVPRFAERLTFRAGAVVTEAEREPDAAYRRRLALYRPWLRPTRPRLLELLNGPGEDGDPNMGALGTMGFSSRFRLVEEDNEFAVAVKLVGSSDEFRDNFLDYVRATHLIHPLVTKPANAIHAARFLSSAMRAAEAELRVRLRAAFDFRDEASANPALGPALAAALLRAVACRKALGVTARWPLLRAQRSDRGSRYELGLGADVAPFSAAQIRRMTEALADPNRPAADDPEVEAILGGLVPRTRAEDPDARWLLEPCGLTTVHRVDTGRLYLSHLPTYGLVIDGPSVVAPGDSAAYEARYHAPGDPGANAVLVGALAAVTRALTAAGEPGFTELGDAAARDRLRDAPARPGGDPALGVFRAAGLPAVADVGRLAGRIERLPEELLAAIELDASLAAAIVGGKPASVERLRRLAALLESEGIASVLPFVTATDEVVLVVGVIGLPEAGINLADQRTTGFRWYAVPVQGDAGEVRTLGSRTLYGSPATPGVRALVVLGYARRGLTDPYEFRVELPEEALLDLLQYELVMNALDHAHPLGVEINTFALRRHHVDLDADGVADPLSPAAARTFRPYRRRRHRGEAALTLGP
jgi:hypothetical protein